jgi:hypothetical protein
MQYRDEKVYIVTTSGHLACLDASAQAITAAQAGQVPDVKRVLAGVGVQMVTPAPATVATTGDASSGVLLECYADGARLRMRVLSPGHDQSWSVQFPSDIRVAGAKYVVSEVKASSRSGFYRAYGDIRKLV